MRVHKNNSALYFRPHQCWAKTGDCWCVDRNGVIIPGLGGVPKCPTHDKKSQKPENEPNVIANWFHYDEMENLLEDHFVNGKNLKTIHNINIINI